MNKLNFYFDQLVTPDDLNNIQNNAESAIRRLAKYGIGSAVYSGLLLTPNGLGVDVSPGLAFDSDGKAIAVSASQHIDLASYQGTQDLYVSIVLKFATQESNEKTDGYGQTLMYNVDDSYSLQVIEGTSEPPSIPSDSVLLGDVLIRAGATEVSSDDISSARRSSALSLAELQAQLMPLLTSVKQGFMGLYEIVRHGLGTWPVTIFAIPTQDPEGQLGDLAAVCTPNAMVLVSSSGDENNHPDIPIDYLVVGKDARAELSPVFSSDDGSGSVIHGLARNHFAFSLPTIFFDDDDQANFGESGEYWVQRGDNLDEISFTATYPGMIQIASAVLFDLIGTASFNGRDGTSITHSFDATNHQIFVVPIEDTDGDLGEVWVEKGNGESVVKNSGGFRGQFAYVIKQL